LAKDLGSSALTVSSRLDSGADIAPLAIGDPRVSTSARVRTPRGPVTVLSQLVGAHNLSNLLVALGIAAALGLDVEQAAAGLSGPIAVPGRLERCDGANDDIMVL